MNETVSIPRKYHRTLLGEKSIFIHDIEAKTNSQIRFPDKETASDLVTIFGPESQVHIAATMLLVSPVRSNVSADSLMFFCRITYRSRLTWPFLLILSLLVSVHPLTSLHSLRESSTSCR